MRRAAAALALAAAGAVSAAPGPAPPRGERVALEPLRAKGVAPALVDTVEERLCAALAEASAAEVVCPADVAAAAQLARQSVMLGECTTEECLKRVDAMRSADRRVTGALERSEAGGLVLSLRLEGPAGAGPRVAERLPEDLDALVARLPVVARKLFP